MSLFAELKRRNVFRIAAAYVVIGWLVLQLADIVLGFIAAPNWVGQALIALLLLGFVPVLAPALPITHKSPLSESLAGQMQGAPSQQGLFPFKRAQHGQRLRSQGFIRCANLAMRLRLPCRWPASGSPEGNPANGPMLRCAP